jgi:parvulin-like peptidyl-prolyl isomerase
MKNLKSHIKVKNLKKKVTGWCGKVCRNKKLPRFKSLVIVGLVLISAILFIRFFLVVAVVNGRPITRISLIKELEKQGGQSILDGLIEKSLIYQEAGKQNISISKEELDAEIKSIEDYIQEQGLSLDEALSMRGQTKSDLADQIKLQRLVEKILGEKISVSDEEIKAYFDENASLYDAGTKLETVKDQIKETLFQQKLSEEYYTWVEELKTKAKINYFVSF